MNKSDNATAKAEEQRHAASAAIELLTERLGPDLPRFVDLFEAASFRFRPALVAAIHQPEPCTQPAFAGFRPSETADGHQ